MSVNSPKDEKSAGAVIFYIENNVPYFLLLKYVSYWGFAKGRIEKDESEEEAAKREIEEETGLKVSFIPDFRYEQKWFFKMNNEFVNKKAVFFLAGISKPYAEKLKISAEHEDFTWKTYEKACKLMRIKSNKEMLRFALDFISEHKKQKKLF